MSMLAQGIRLDPPYDGYFHGLPSFKSFEDVECTIGKLESFRQRFLTEGDRAGLHAIRRVALLGRKRAEAVGRSKRVSLLIRRQKQEMAQWYQVWLETPDIFFTWLGLRKDTAEYRDLASPGSTSGLAGTECQNVPD
jgi:hypothetical protein